MNPASEDIKDMLVSYLALTFQTNLFIGSLPAQAPDNCVVVFDTPGFEADLTLKKGENYFRPSVQIMVRNKSYLTAYTLIDSIKTTLHGVGHETWNGTTYELIKCTQDPFPLGYDEDNRIKLICNFDIQRH